jgi:hypothetical protein
MTGENDGLFLADTGPGCDWAGAGGCCGLPQALPETSSDASPSYFLLFFFGLFIFRSRVLPDFLSYLVPSSYPLLSLSLSFFPSFFSLGVDLGFVSTSRRIVLYRPRRFYLSTRNIEKEYGFAL